MPDPTQTSNPVTPEQLDAIREVVNIGAGHAATNLSTLTGLRVMISVPRIQWAQGEVEAARAEVVRAEVEVSRLTPLVSSGQASQGELDGARATYEKAQQRLQRAQAAAQGAETKGTVSAPSTSGSAAGLRGFRQHEK